MNSLLVKLLNNIKTSLDLRNNRSDSYNNFKQLFCQEENKKPYFSQNKVVFLINFIMVRPRGIEPPHLAPEASALSTELRAYIA